jgi:hypothetical protein
MDMNLDIGDVKIDKLMILLLLMFAETPLKPKTIKNFTDDWPIYKWIILFLLTIRRKNGLTYFILFYFLYQIFYMVDYAFVL